MNVPIQCFPFLDNLYAFVIRNGTPVYAVWWIHRMAWSYRDETVSPITRSFNVLWRRKTTIGCSVVSSSVDAAQIIVGAARINEDLFIVCDERSPRWRETRENCGRIGLTLVLHHEDRLVWVNETIDLTLSLFENHRKRKSDGLKWVGLLIFFSEMRIWIGWEKTCYSSLPFSREKISTDQKRLPWRFCWFE